MKLGTVWHYHVIIEDMKPPDKIRKDGRVVDPDQMGILGPEGRRGLFQVVVGYLGEHVVDLVGAYVVGEAVGPAIVPVH